MNLTAEQLQIASMIDAKMQKLVCDGNDDLTILGEMFDYMVVHVIAGEVDVFPAKGREVLTYRRPCSVNHALPAQTYSS